MKRVAEKVAICFSRPGCLSLKTGLNLLRVSIVRCEVKDELRPYPLCPYHASSE